MLADQETIGTQHLEHLLAFFVPRSKRPSEHSHYSILQINYLILQSPSASQITSHPITRNVVEIADKVDLHPSKEGPTIVKLLRPREGFLANTAI